MTRPDGTYEIDGIPPGQYYLYVHPLPPPQPGEATSANIVPPADPQKDSFAANTGFVTQFLSRNAGLDSGGSRRRDRRERGEECQLRGDVERRPRGLRHVKPTAIRREWRFLAPPFSPNARNALVFTPTERR